MADQPLSDRLDGVIDALVARGDATSSLRDTALAPLARVAAELRHYPNRDFTTRLRAQLERRTNMTTAVGNPAEAGLYLREGFTTVTPYVWVPDRGFADFVARVFDAVETRVADNPGHGIHREMRIGSSMLMIGESGEPTRPSRPVAFHVFVDNADATFAKAIAAGGTSIGDPEDRPYGERSGFIRDPYGNSWYIAHPLGSESLGSHLRSVTPYLLAHDVRGYIEFLVRAFGAVEEVVVDHGGGAIPYARARIGDAAVEFGSADPMPGSYFLYVADPDAVYEQALAAGAKALAPPADQPSGIRIGYVEDPVGNHWYIARPA
ncbi:MAG: VOC family protein [Vicinamibacterales bacterium]